jgi:hypothetical protein
MRLRFSPYVPGDLEEIADYIVLWKNGVSGCNPLNFRVVGGAKTSFLRVTPGPCQSNRGAANGDIGLRTAKRS